MIALDVAGRLDALDDDGRDLWIAPVARRRRSGHGGKQEEQRCCDRANHSCTPDYSSSGARCEGAIFRKVDGGYFAAMGWKTPGGCVKSNESIKLVARASV